MWKKISGGFVFEMLLLLVGVTLILYPVFSDWWSKRKQTDAIAEYMKSMENGDVAESEVLGYITIPKIDVSLPIYSGTNESVLQKGVGHMEGTSFPLGGKSTHSVLAGHRGLPSAKLFSELDKMEVGDIFTLHVQEKTLNYEVDQIVVVAPDEVAYLAVVEGEDYCTLLTCTPYGVNTHRLLVRGRRVYCE